VSGAIRLVKPPRDLGGSIARRAAIAHLLISGHGRSARAIWLHGAGGDDPTISAMVARAVNVTQAIQSARSMRARHRGTLRGEVAAQLIAEMEKDHASAIKALQLSPWWAMGCGHAITDYDGAACGWGCGGNGGAAGGGGRAPVIPDNMPASVNPTPCGS
jgi:hypothetical protein